MTVKELIEQLKLLDQNLPICFQGDEPGIYKVHNVREYDALSSIRKCCLLEP